VSIQLLSYQHFGTRQAGIGIIDEQFLAGRVRLPQGDRRLSAYCWWRSRNLLYWYPAYRYISISLSSLP